MAGAVKSIFRDMSVELERAIAASGDLRLRGPACQYRDPQGPRRELHNKRQMTNQSKEASRIRVLRQSSAAADCLWRSVTDRSRERAILNEKDVWHRGDIIINLEKIGKRECHPGHMLNLTTTMF